MSSRSSERGKEGSDVVSVPVGLRAPLEEGVGSCWCTAVLEEVVDALIVGLAERRVAVGWVARRARSRALPPRALDLSRVFGMFTLNLLIARLV